MATSTSFRSRSSNFSELEIEKLIEEIDLHKETLFNTVASKTNVEKKQRAWESVAHAVNSVDCEAPPRDWHQYRKKFQDLKAQCRSTNVMEQMPWYYTSFMGFEEFKKSLMDKKEDVPVSSFSKRKAKPKPVDCVSSSIKQRKKTKPLGSVSLSARGKNFSSREVRKLLEEIKIRKHILIPTKSDEPRIFPQDHYAEIRQNWVEVAASVSSLDGGQVHREWWQCKKKFFDLKWEARKYVESEGKRKRHFCMDVLLDLLDLPQVSFKEIQGPPSVLTEVESAIDQEQVEPEPSISDHPMLVTVVESLAVKEEPPSDEVAPEVAPDVIMKKSNKKARFRNFSFSETAKLLQAVKFRKHLLEQTHKEQDLDPNNIKSVYNLDLERMRRVWCEVADEVNKVYPEKTHRTWKQCRKKFHDIRSDCRMYTRRLKKFGEQGGIRKPPFYEHIMAISRPGSPRSADTAKNGLESDLAGSTHRANLGWSVANCMESEPTAVRTQCSLHNVSAQEMDGFYSLTETDFAATRESQDGVCHICSLLMPCSPEGEIPEVKHAAAVRCHQVAQLYVILVQRQARWSADQLEQCVECQLSVPGRREILEHLYTHAVDEISRQDKQQTHAVSENFDIVPDLSLQENKQDYIPKCEEVHEESIMEDGETPDIQQNVVIVTDSNNLLPLFSDGDDSQPLDIQHLLVENNTQPSLTDPSVEERTSSGETHRKTRNKPLRQTSAQVEGKTNETGETSGEPVSRNNQGPFRRRGRLQKNKTYLCELCGKSWTRRQHYREHMDVVHNNIQRYKCTFCGEKFGQLYKLEKHKTTHKPLECNVCGRNFTDKYYFMRHKLAHSTGIKPHRCHLCSRSYMSRWGLKVHLKVHETGKLPFQCTLCNSQFFSKARLRWHTARRHGLPEGSYPCTQCSDVYQSEEELKEHVRSHNKSILCQICGKSYKKTDQYRQHMIKKHNFEDPQYVYL